MKPAVKVTEQAAQTTTAYAHLAACDPRLAALIAAVGMPEPSAWAGSDDAGDDLFAGLVLHIIGQQISIPAALTIYRRLGEATDSARPTSTGVADLDEQALRQIGVSGSKARSLSELAQRVELGGLELRNLHASDDAEALAILMSLRGIGAWTAQMFLMHQLRRPDILPVGDVGLREAVKRTWNLPQRPSEDEFLRLAEPWRPFRSYATTLLWAGLKADT